MYRKSSEAQAYYAPPPEFQACINAPPPEFKACIAPPPPALEATPPAELSMAEVSIIVDKFKVDRSQIDLQSIIMEGKKKWCVIIALA